MHEDELNPAAELLPTPVDARWRRFIQKREPALREELIGHHLEFARVVAAKLYRLRRDNSVPFDDYLQYARAGLIEAIDCFDPAMAVPFERFSFHRIRGSILNGLEAESELAAQRKAGLPTGLYERLHSFDLDRSNNAQEDALHRWVDKVVGVALGLLLDRAQEGLADENIHANPYARVELLHLRRRILSCLQTLPTREREVIHLHYFEHLEFQFIAERLSISKGRVSQLHARGLKQLRELIGKDGKLDASL